MVVHGVNQQAVTLGVQHHSGDGLDLAHQLAGWNCLKTDLGQKLSSVRLTGSVEVQPLIGELQESVKSFSVL